MYPDIPRYFFTDNILTWKWFKDKADTVLQSSEVKAKYKNALHVREKANKEIARVLGGNRFADDLQSRMLSSSFTSCQKNRPSPKNTRKQAGNTQLANGIYQWKK